MRDYVLMTDSCCDLTDYMARELELEVLPLTMHMDGQDYPNDLAGTAISNEEFYKRIRAGKLATTSAVNVGQFQDAMRRVLQSGKDIVCVCFSSALSTTGYATMGYDTWPAFAVGILILLMLIGGGMGSTAGGLKLTRVYLLLRMIGQNLKRKLVPGRLVDTPTFTKAQGKAKIDDTLCSDTLGFAGCYLLLFITGALVLTLTAECGLTEAMFEFASALGTVGLSIGLTGPATGSATLIVEMIGMIMGRLEIFIVLTGIYFGLNRVKFIRREHKKARQQRRSEKTVS